MTKIKEDQQSPNTFAIEPQLMQEEESKGAGPMSYMASGLE